MSRRRSGDGKVRRHRVIRNRSSREGEGQTTAHTPSVYACGSSKPQRVLLPTHLCLRDAQMLLLCSDILRTRHGPALSPASSQTVLGTAGGRIPSPPSCFQKLSLGCELHTGWDGGSSRVGTEVICCSMGKSCLTLWDPRGPKHTRLLCPFAISWSQPKHHT